MTVGTLFNIMTSEHFECAMPYVRAKASYIPETIKYQYEREITVTKKITSTMDAGITTISTETVQTMQTRKVTLKLYGHSSDEDCEHFFECFEKLQKEMDQEWTQISRAKPNNATLLFDAFEHMLTSNALSQWHDILSTENQRTWEHFKILVSQFICFKILPADAYDLQVTYMQESVKPRTLSAKEWWLRMQTLNRYLPYFFPSMESLKVHFPTSTFREWWTEGGMSSAMLKRIVMHKIPTRWQAMIKMHDIGHEYRNTKPTDGLIDYFTTLEQMEQSAMKATLKNKPNDVNDYHENVKHTDNVNDYNYGSVDPWIHNIIARHAYPARYNNNNGSVDPRYHDKEQDKEEQANDNERQKTKNETKEQAQNKHMQQKSTQGGRDRNPTTTYETYNEHFPGQRNEHDRFQSNSNNYHHQNEHLYYYQENEYYDDAENEFYDAYNGYYGDDNYDNYDDYNEDTDY